MPQLRECSRLSLTWLRYGVVLLNGALPNERNNFSHSTIWLNAQWSLAAVNRKSRTGLAYLLIMFILLRCNILSLCAVLRVLKIRSRDAGRTKSLPPLCRVTPKYLSLAVWQKGDCR